MQNHLNKEINVDMQVVDFSSTQNKILNKKWKNGSVNKKVNNLLADFRSSHAETCQSEPLELPKKPYVGFEASTMSFTNPENQYTYIEEAFTIKNSHNHNQFYATLPLPKDGNSNSKLST